MAVRIRMKRLGRKHRPFFRICVMPQHKHREAPPIEEVGTYDPMVADKSARCKMNLERIEYWISVGAQPSEAVAALIKKTKTNNWGTAKSAPALQTPKARPAKAAEGAEAEAPAAPTEG
ncbi:MAG: rpsP [Planctomycetaceae bacterium]|nr:rpsP [Planctomycetaceae bacterium]